jgi:monofunctional biosynthetic peptidoglycan transglycosylase
MRRVLRAAIVVTALGFVYFAYIYLTLPDVRPLATINPTTTAFMELRKREAAEAGRKLQIRQQWVPYTRISNTLRRAVLVAEDSAFFDHEGVDFKELRASLEANWEDGQFTRGASTITQQLAKNLYLAPSRNPVRKLRELMITRRLEAALTKRRILEIYLNVIEWGDGIFGAEAASRIYFGKSASALTTDEAALLAATDGAAAPAPADHLAAYGGEAGTSSRLDNSLRGSDKICRAVRTRGRSGQRITAESNATGAARHGTFRAATVYERRVTAGNSRYSEGFRRARTPQVRHPCSPGCQRRGRLNCAAHTERTAGSNTPGAAGSTTPRKSRTSCRMS